MCRVFTGPPRAWQADTSSPARGRGAWSLTFRECPAVSDDLAKVPARVTALNLLLSSKGWVPLLSV